MPLGGPLGAHGGCGEKGGSPGGDGGAVGGVGGGGVGTGAMTGGGGGGVDGIPPRHADMRPWFETLSGDLATRISSGQHHPPDSCMPTGQGPSSPSSDCIESATGAIPNGVRDLYGVRISDPSALAPPAGRRDGGEASIADRHWHDHSQALSALLAMTPDLRPKP